VNTVTEDTQEYTEEYVRGLEIALMRLSLRIAKQRPRVELVGTMAEWLRIADEALNRRRG
jgi:hypothetical protein